MATMFANVGGGIVRRRFKDKRPGTTLTAAEVASIAPRNLRALLDSHALEVWPASPDQPGMHLVHIGRGTYDVYRGWKLTSDPVSREEAEEIAAQG